MSEQVDEVVKHVVQQKAIVEMVQHEHEVAIRDRRHVMMEQTVIQMMVVMIVVS